VIGYPSVDALLAAQAGPDLHDLHSADGGDGRLDVTAKYTGPILAHRHRATRTRRGRADRQGRRGHPHPHRLTSQSNTSAPVPTASRYRIATTGSPDPGDAVPEHPRPTVTEPAPPAPRAGSAGHTGHTGRRLLTGLRRDPLRLLVDLTVGHDRTATLRIGRRRRLLVVTHPSTAWELLSLHAGDLSKGPALRRARILLGNGLLTAEDPAHRAHRRIAQPAFTRAAMSAYATTFTQATRSRTGAWTPGRSLDLTAETAAITLDIAGRTLFGVDLTGHTDRLRTDLATVADTTRLLPLPGPGTLRRTRAVRRIHATTDAILLTRERPTRPGGHAVLTDLLAAALPGRQLHDEAVTMLLAGHETTALALAWTLSALAHHAQVRDRLEQEVDHVLGDGAGGHRDPTLEDHLPVADAVLAEALRLWPPAWVIGRQAERPFTLDGIPVPAGTVCLVSPYAIHRDPRWWTDPDSFDPDRWLAHDPDSLPMLHSRSRAGGPYLPFGIGPRRCIGEQFAWTEARLVLATITTRWRLLAHGPIPRPGHPTLTLRPAGPITVTAQPRTATMPHSPQLQSGGR
jgi:cytochrome P450